MASKKSIRSSGAGTGTPKGSAANTSTKVRPSQSTKTAGKTSAPRRIAAAKPSQDKPSTPARRQPAANAATGPRVAGSADTVDHRHNPSSEQRQQMIAEAAYFLAEKRSFAPGGEFADWLAAERSIDEQIAT